MSIGLGVVIPFVLRSVFLAVIDPQPRVPITPTEPLTKLSKCASNWVQVVFPFVPVIPVSANFFDGYE